MTGAVTFTFTIKQSIDSKSMKGNPFMSRNETRHSNRAIATSSLPLRIAVVGLGPRGLAIIEQICRQAEALADRPIVLLLFDPGAFGEGCHQRTQPRHFLMNTAAAQLSWTSDPHDTRNTFEHWLKLRGLDKGDAARTPSTSDGYYSRAVFGEYLRESLQALLEEAPDHIAWSWTQQEVNDLSENDDGTWNVITPHEVVPSVHCVHLCTGHGPVSVGRNAANRLAPDAGPHPLTPSVAFQYPVTHSLSAIGAQHTVAVEGMGLSAFDVVSELTEGRGGRFSFGGQGGLLNYHPSGEEPAIIAYSRTGLPLKAKPKGQNQAHVEREYRHLSSMAIEDLMSKKPLDFERHVLPLVERELKEVYYTTLLNQIAHPLPASAANVKESSQDPLLTLAELESKVPAHQRITLQSLLHPLERFDMRSPETFRQSLELYLREDLLHAEEGVGVNPEKSATSLLRDIRETLASLIDFSALQAESHDWLYLEFMPKMKWLSVGPPRSRIAEWLALSRAGVLNLTLGPAPACDLEGSGWCLRSRVWPAHKLRADTRIQARIQVFDDIFNQPLVQNLNRKQQVTPYMNGTVRKGGLAVTRDFRLIRPTGEPYETLWATGLLTEGERFYTFTLPSPGKASRFHEDAVTAVKSMFATVGRPAEYPVAGESSW